MASYVESSLTTGEKVEQRAQITKVIYVRPVFWLVVAVLFCLGGLGIVPVALFIVTAISLIRTFLVVSMWKRWGCQLCFWKNSALSL